MDRYLIINADDFGMCRGSNLAVMDLFKDEKSALTSSTVMAPCAWAPEACQFASANPELAIGVHLTFTSEWSKYRWRPVSASACPSLRDEYGYMHSDCIGVEKNATEKTLKNVCEILLAATTSRPRCAYSPFTVAIPEAHSASFTIRGIPFLNICFFN